MIRKTTWIVLALFVLLLAATFGWQRWQEQKMLEESETEALSADLDTLFTIDEKIEAVRLERVGEKMLEMKRGEDDVWVITWPLGFEADSPSIEGRLSGLMALTVITSLDEAPPLEAMGLDRPRYRLLVTLESGKQLYASVGKETPTGDGYYVLTSERRLVVVSKFSLDNLMGLIDRPPLKPTPTAQSTETPAEDETPPETETPQATP